MTNYYPGYPYEDKFGRPELTEAYVLPQIFCQMYSLEEGLREGTIFPELNRPYKKGGPIWKRAE
ncbi:spore coat associated protein CotJA [Calorimonas adulescens]|jgi:hypothetical protein|uniref:Spore coat associated protein CotJA n=1 Tax=Calorimonas adulescens TaxID=2606906 RepID=A0A5D8Q8E8_9THEO|nr:spore coat associated protein CotJA [Calorimonas adulescens]MDI6601034.1 spore coat associated protein CotJA [Thermoanaerobacteraceae bacterium]TZE81045.1 spore coat associated protein CotJA [Calorimonas adulescens]